MSMPMYTCWESQATISPPARSASASANALFPDAVGPSTATNRSPPGVPASGTVSDTAEAPLDLRQRHAQQYRASVRAVRTEIHGIELRQQRQGLGPPERVAGADDAVTGDRGQQVIDAVELAVAQRRAV